MKKRPRVRRRRLVVALEEEVYRAVKMRAARELTTAAQLITAWVRSWEKKRV